MEVRDTNSWGIEKAIASLYIVLLPLRMLSPLIPVVGIFNACASYFDFILHVLGFCLMLMSTRGKLYTTRSANAFAVFVFVAEAISFTMAVLLNGKLGALDGEDTFTAILGPAIYYLHYLVIMFYNIYIFQMFTKDELSKLIDKMIKWTLILGYIQIAICIGNQAIGSLYDTLDFLDVFRDASYITTISRIPVAGSEPAAAGCYIGLVVFPYLMSKIIAKTDSRKYMMMLLLWLPVIFFTKSSTCFILVFVDLFVFLILFIRNRGINKSILAMTMFILALSGILYLISSDAIGNSELAETIRYLLFEKSGDRTNESTVTRTIPTYINLNIFAEYPIFGVGNGNQGFFYSKYFPEWGDISLHTFSAIQGVADGGVFIPSLLSGYGLVGFIVFVLCGLQHIKTAIGSKFELGYLYYMFIIASFAFVVNSFQGDYFGNYMTLFVMCIPFFAEINFAEDVD